MKTFSYLFLIMSCTILYVPDASAQRIGDSEVGNAVYYADYLHGRKTASGELYDKNALTASHKTYPYGTILKVVRLDNNKVVKVRVNDRGPYGEGLVVDISKAAASRLGLLRDGKTRVQIEVIGFSDNNPTIANNNTDDDAYYSRSGTVSTYEARINRAYPTSKERALNNISGVLTPTAKNYDYSKFDQPYYEKNSSTPANTPRSYSNEVFTARGVPSSASTGRFVVQVGSFSDMSNADRQVSALRRAGLNNVSILTKTLGRKTYNKVVVGPYNSRASADEALLSIEARYSVNGFVMRP